MEPDALIKADRLHILFERPEINDAAAGELVQRPPHQRIADALMLVLFQHIESINLARINLATITGLRCGDMTEDELIRRGVECAADCTADNAAGVLFYTALFGGLGGIFYRTVSILRRTYSVRSSASDDFGTAVHKLWTVLGFVPAHIASFIAVLPANIMGCHTENCWDVFKRDRKHLQAAVLAPCRCVFASALGITLTPKSVFKDGFIQYLKIGDEEETASFESVLTAGEIMYGTAFFTMLLFAALKLTVILLFF